MALNPPPVDVVAEAKRIMKRARGSEDSKQNDDAAKWRAVEAAVEAMESDIEQMAGHEFDEQSYMWNVCASSQCEFESCDEDMEAPGKGGQGECLDGGKSHPHP